jgi:radical SAM protein with 4Fe4S-binding SPASM domain
MNLKNIWDLGIKFAAGGRPMALIYFVTKRCNAFCAHCFYWESLNERDPNELGIDELEKISADIGSLLYLRLSGGEPFLRKDIFDLVNTFVKNCSPAYVGIPTNGFFTDRIIDFASRAKELDTRVEIGISIDDMGEHHDRLRSSPNAFKNAIQTFTALKKIKKQVPNLNIGFITTAVKSNQSRLMELFQFLKSLEPDSIACNMVRGDTKVKNEKDIDKDITRHFASMCDAYSRRKAVERNDFFSRMRNAKTELCHEIRSRTLETNHFQIPCVAGRNIIVMYADGEIHPCETLGYEIGNIRDYGLSMTDLLKSERARSIRRKIIHAKCFCTHECFTTASVTFRKKQLLKVAARAVTQQVG